MSNSKITRTSILLMFSLFIIGFSANQARADVRINIGLGYPTGYVDHRHHGYIVQHHNPRYSYNRHQYHQPKKYYSKHKHHYHQPKKYYSKHKHHPKSYRGHGKHRDHYRYESRGNHRNYEHREHRYYR